MSEIPYTTISVSGADAFAFLQAQLATDMKVVSRDDPVRSAWCNPKGRVICIPTIIASDAGFALTLPTDLANVVVERLTLFRFRYKVEFKLLAAKSRRTEEQLAQLRAGIVEIALAQSEKFTPHMLNLDLLHIVSLDKGCYPGQEIVARTHYRGASKRRCMRFESSEPVAAGDKVSDGERDIGEVVNALGTDLLAVVPVDAADHALTVGAIRLSKGDLPYAIGP
jgi:folate-binding protein YgfZ